MPRTGSDKIPPINTPVAHGAAHRWQAFLYAVPIAILGGLIGLGGAEFRLPVLVGPLNYPPRRAVPLNLAVSVITLAASLALRGRTLSLTALTPLSTAIGALITGAVVFAFIGATLATRLSSRMFGRIIVGLLIAIGSALIIEAFLPTEGAGLIPARLEWQIAAGLLLGSVLGLVSSVLGVAGGELIIPTLVFGFGADIKTAGTASLLISLPTVVVGLLRYARRGAFMDRAPLRATVLPMGVGSGLGAVIGGLLVGVIAASVLKLLLGVILIVSALRVRHH